MTLFRAPTVPIEWPAGSGRRADYEPHELVLVREWGAQFAAGTIGRDELLAQTGLLHDVKVEAGGRLLTTIEDYEAR